MRWWGVVILVAGLLIGVALYNRRRVMKGFENTRLSEHFSLDEFVVTATGLENTPGPGEITALGKLCVEVLQKLRDYFGWAITITSGFRSALVNSLIPGSSSTSQHPKGEAADIVIQFVYPKSKYATEDQAYELVLEKISGRLTTGNLETRHTSTLWVWKLTNQTIIDAIRMLRLPFDQIIDEERGNPLASGGKSIWVHISHKAAGVQRLQWMTRRDVGPERPKEYETIKYGFA